MERGVSLSCRQCSIVILFLPPSPPPPTNPTLHLSHKPNFSSHLRFSQRRWDSNAETFRTQRSKFNFRDTADKDDDDADDYDYDGSRGMEPGSGILEEVIDSIWILKVFGSFGWMLPLIILSILLTTGLKAFLLALALPLGLSALSLAFKKLWGMTQNSPKQRVRTKKKPFGRAPGNVVMDDEPEKSRGSRKRKMGYQSWVARNGVSVDKDVQAAPKFGGWDQLDGREEIGAESKQRRSAQTAGSSQRTQVEGKLSWGRRKGGTPFLLRLLIAVFPFLSSWTKIL